MDKEEKKKENKKTIKKEENKKKIATKTKKVFSLVKLKDFFKERKDISIGIVLTILDIILIIYVARSNIANYVNVNGEEIFVGETKNLLFGRNYITLVITVFIYIYWFAINKKILKIMISRKHLIWLFIGILLFNMMLFFAFTNKVY